jgi:hypothetical protein
MYQIKAKFKESLANIEHPQKIYTEGFVVAFY